MITKAQEERGAMNYVGKRYKLLECYTAAELEMQANAMLELGWLVVGPPTCTVMYGSKTTTSDTSASTSYSIQYVQAMVASAEVVFNTTMDG